MVTIDTILSKGVRGSGARAQSAWLFAGIRSFVQWLKLWKRRRATRVHLSQLTEHQLRDVGLTPDIADREIRKSRLLLIERRYQPPF